MFPSGHRHARRGLVAGGRAGRQASGGSRSPELVSGLSLYMVRDGRTDGALLSDEARERLGPAPALPVFPAAAFSASWQDPGRQAGRRRVRALAAAAAAAAARLRAGGWASPHDAALRSRMRRRRETAAWRRPTASPAERRPPPPFLPLQQWKPQGCLPQILSVPARQRMRP